MHVCFLCPPCGTRGTNCDLHAHLCCEVHLLVACCLGVPICTLFSTPIDRHVRHPNEVGQGTCIFFVLSLSVVWLPYMCSSCVPFGYSGANHSLPYPLCRLWGKLWLVLVLVVVVALVRVLLVASLRFCPLCCLHMVKKSFVGVCSGICWNGGRGHVLSHDRIAVCSTFDAR